MWVSVTLESLSWNRGIRLFWVKLIIFPSWGCGWASFPQLLLSPGSVDRGFQTLVRDCRLSRGYKEAKKRLKRGKAEVKSRLKWVRELLSRPNSNHRFETTVCKPSVCFLGLVFVTKHATFRTDVTSVSEAEGPIPLWVTIFCDHVHVHQRFPTPNPQEDSGQDSSHSAFQYHIPLCNSRGQIRTPTPNPPSFTKSIFCVS